ncbi:MAG: endonuclease/exonuclease/phosphatase family protein [Actinobacteria bacterium]|nr:endonuclease/exonuclease/phosphatase family protein [Actinomycetota bacterium]
MSDGAATLRLAFWNTWLLRPRLWRDGPVLPGGAKVFAPDVEARASLVGEAVRDRFDVVALAEVFEASEQRAVAAAWPGVRAVPGPQRRGIGRTGSGLLTLVDPRRATVTHTAHHAYRARGDLRDSDSMASKGVVLTRIRVADHLPEVDVFATHLIAGGDLIPAPGADHTHRHHGARMRQVDELVAFVEEHHRPANAVLVVGDLNVAAHDPDTPDPQHRYEDLALRFGRIGLVDLWAQHGVGHGHTCTFTEPHHIPVDDDHPDLVADHPDHDHTHPGERIDYLWLAQPADGAVVVQAERPRRWAFRDRGVVGGPAGSLSDHLALSTTLTLRPA